MSYCERIQVDAQVLQGDSPAAPERALTALEYSAILIGVLDFRSGRKVRAPAPQPWLKALLGTVFGRNAYPVLANDRLEALRISAIQRLSGVDPPVDALGDNWAGFEPALAAALDRARLRNAVSARHFRQTPVDRCTAGEAHDPTL